MSKVAGVLFFLTGVTVVMGIITAEIFYPTTYSISQNMISNLGSTPPPDSIIHQPAASIFDKSLLVAGLLIVIGSYFLSGYFKSRLFLTILALMGIGTLGVGLFPAFHKMIHPFFALIAFLIGGVAALFSVKFVTAPFKFLSFILGAITLGALFLGIFFTSWIVPIMGAGGIERWVAYPIMLWLVGFGGYLMAKEK